MIRLLVVDDSALMRRLMSEVFTEAGDFEIAFARDGLDALAQLESFKPNVITLDVQMPNMDGLTCLDRIMLERPCPVVMISSLTQAGVETTLKALAMGAVDFIAKPDGAISLKIDELAPILVDKVRQAAKSRPRAAHRLAERVRLRSGATATARPATRRIAPKIAVEPLQGTDNGEAVVLIGTSTGGPAALDALLSSLPADFPWPLVVAQHMPATFTDALARRLDRLCALDVLEVRRPTPLVRGRVYIGKGDADVILGARPEGLVVLAAPSSAEFRWHPSVERLVMSALAHVPADRLIGVMMTGMGNDGAAAMAQIRQGGGHTIAEAEESAVVWGMPGELVRAGGAEFVVRLDEIADRLLDLVAAAAEVDET
ncbi:MAG: chemotaxis-specific protein-glutamate methyltransferase CheB [Methylocella sp.]